VIWYGALVSSAPMLAPSTRNCTPASPRSSAAVAVTCTSPVTVAPSAGAVIETVGGTPLSTLTATCADVVAFPAASRATAVSWWVPLAAVRVFQATKYGAEVSAAPRSAPSSRNWTLATPRSSVALAVTSTVAPTVAPAAGAEIDTVGAVTSPVTVPLASFEAGPALPAASTATTR
jgi:hypothetical protein